MQTNSPDPVRLAKLSEGQKACLRLVYAHMSSKDIARDLGISPHTVDARLRAAIHTLGVATRVEAARQLATAEAAAPYQSSVYQSPHVAAAPASDMLVPGNDTGKRDGRDDIYRRAAAGAPRPQRVAEAVAAFDAAPAVWPGPASPSTRLRAWGGRNDLGLGARVGVTLAIAIGSALAFGAILSGLESLARLT
jgi:DNA-binding CsgD family transcriptional regulator